jgi:hypothetical protein
MDQHEPQPRQASDGVSLSNAARKRR